MTTLTDVELDAAYERISELGMDETFTVPVDARARDALSRSVESWEPVSEGIESAIAYVLCMPDVAERLRANLAPFGIHPHELKASYVRAVYET